jgi:polar amino acid transport system substrate-binding protein
MRRGILLLLAFLACLVSGFPSAMAADRTLKVGVAGSPPFVVTAPDASKSGFAVELWKELARERKYAFELVTFDSVPLALESLQKREIDVAIGPISITAERHKVVAFTQPYFRASLGIMASTRQVSMMDRLKPFLSKAFGTAIVILLLLLTLVGTLVWLAERRRNPQQFSESWLHGIGEGIWLALVTLTTVGYGDRVPVTPVGRVVVGLWMLVSMVTASTLTAGLATAFTLSQIETQDIERPDQLAGRTVAVVQGTTGDQFAKGIGARVLRTRNLAAAIEQVVSKRADAVVFDRPALLYYASEHAELPLRVAAATFHPQSYGFALRLENNLLQDFNFTLLSLAESEKLSALREKWMPDPTESSAQRSE